MNTKRIEEIQKQTAYPQSHSVYQALMQVWNEMQQDFGSRTCENCRWYCDMNESSGICAHTALPDIGVDKDFGCNKFMRKEDV